MGPEAAFSDLLPSPESSTVMSVPAEGIYDQEVPNHACDADGENHRADGVVGVVGHIHGGE